MNQLNCNTLFSGIGGSDCGLGMAGFTPQLAFELDPDLAALGQHNTNARYVVGDICDVDFTQFVGCDVLAASPVCKEFSIAKSGGVESDIDIATARATVRALEAWRPRGFILENVWGYRNSVSFLLICEALNRLGYRFGFWHLCAADFGVAQTRRRLILIATKSQGGRLMPPPPTHSREVATSLFGGLERWIGWYEAIADLVDDLPETEFAPWQLERLGAIPEFSFLLGDQQGQKRDCAAPAFTICAKESCFAPAPVRAFVVEGSAAGLDNKFNLPVREADEPIFTMRARQNNPRAFVACGMTNDRGESMTVRVDGEHRFTVNAQTRERQPARAFLVNGDNPRSGTGQAITIRDETEPSFTVTAASGAIRHRAAREGRVVALNTRCLARLQSFPDSFELSGNRKLDTTGIGNAVPPLMMKAIAEHLKNLL